MISRKSTSKLLYMYAKGRKKRLGSRDSEQPRPGDGAAALQILF